VKGIIDKGRGPNEFYYPEYSIGGDTLYVSNSDPGGIRAIYDIPLSDISKIDDVKYWGKHTVAERDIMTGLSFVPFGKDCFIITGGKTNTKEIFSLINFNCAKRTPLNFWPADSTKGPLHSKQMVYMQSSLSRQKDKFAYANLNSRYLFIAEVKGNNININATIYSHLPQYEIKADENIRYSENGEYGILVQSTPEYIYAQVGRKVVEVKSSADYKGYPRLYVDELEKYDWKGNFIDNYQTDIPFYSFAVSEDNRFLFTMSQDLDTNEQIIMKYKL